MKLKLTILTLLLMIFSSISTYFVTHYFTYKTAYKAGKSAGWQPGYDKGHYDGVAEFNLRVTDDEQKLATITNEYNTLRQNVITYFGSQQAANTHISCTSNTLGSFTDTNCY